MKVEFVPVTDYAAVVESLATGKIDMAWLGGFTYVQSKIGTNGATIPIVQRQEDAAFTRKFITADKMIKSLADLKGRTFAFGSPSSTSGHLMPRHFLLQAGIDLDKDFKTVAYSGAHDATVSLSFLPHRDRQHPYPTDSVRSAKTDARRGPPRTHRRHRPIGSRQDHLAAFVGNSAAAKRGPRRVELFIT
ncbi:phosphate/phosphite/phosphonate ABC transporter, periplasmic binding protein [compost metagenome]